MNPRPLFLSITFWSGLLVISFLCWSWWDSMTHFSAGRYGHMSVTQGVGGVCLGVHESWITPKPYWREKSEGFTTIESGPDGIAFSTVYNTGRTTSPWPVPVTNLHSKDRAIFVPHYLILLAVALPWLGLLIWRSRRIERATLRSAA